MPTQPAARPPLPAAFRAGAAALLVALSIILLMATAVHANGTDKKLFDLPEDSADHSLKAFAAQSGVEVLFGSQVAKGIRTNSVKGEFTPREAIERMVAGTPLVISQNEKTGAIKISRSSDPNGLWAAQVDSGRPRKLAFSPVNQPAGDTPAGRESETIVMPEFRLNEASDQGFGAEFTSGGTRITSEIKKSPITVVVFNQEFRQTVGALDIQELARYSAGVTAAANLGSGQLSLRGQNLSGVTFRDGVPRFANVGEGPDYQDMALVERVELIKGPAGTLFGSHNSGGMVNYVSKVPMDRPSTEVYFVTRPEHDVYRAEVDDTRPLGEGWAYRAIVAYQRGKTQIGTRNDNQAAAISLSKKIRNLNLLARYTREERDWLSSGSWFLDAANQLSTFIPYDEPKGERDGVRNLGVDSFDFEAQMPLDVAGTRLQNRLLVRYTDGAMRTFNYSAADANHRFFNAAGVQIGTALNTRFDDPRLSYIVLTRATSERLADQRSWSANFDTVAEVETGPVKHKLLGYATLFTTFTELIVNSATYAPLNLMNRVYYYPNTAAQRGPWLPTSNDYTESYTRAFAMQDNISVLDERLIFVAGARYDNRIQDNQNRRLNSGVSNDVRKGWSKKLAVVGRPHEALSLYYNYAETFNPAGFDSRTGGKLPNVESSNHEAGFKIGLPMSRLSLTAAWFDVTTENVVISVPGINPITGAVEAFLQPVGETQVKGWEVDFNANIPAGISLLGGIGDLESKTATGVRARGVPIGLNYRLFARYSFPNEGYFRNFWVAAGWEHTSARSLDNPDTYTLPKFDLVDLVAGWSRKRLSLQVNVTNVFDRISPRAATTRADIAVTEPISFRLSARFKL